MMPFVIALLLSLGFLQFPGNNNTDSVEKLIKNEKQTHEIRRILDNHPELLENHGIIKPTSFDETNEM